MADNGTPHPLDHATARIITELASALLPPLKETLSGELVKTARSLPASIDREIEEALTSLKRLRSFSEGMENSLKAAQDSAALFSGELRPLSRTCEIMREMCEILNASAARLERLTAEPVTVAPMTVAPLMDTGKVSELPRSLEEALSDWQGVLKANGRAQTQELSEFSAEVSEQVSWMKSAMPGVIGDILEKALASRADRSEDGTAAADVRALEARLTRLEKIGKILLGEGIVLILLLGILAVFILRL